MSQLIQEKFSNLQDASERAIAVSKESGYSCIILSKGDYFVENEPPFVRSWEELIAEYENGELVK
jgi:hypothetical protein